MPNVYLTESKTVAWLNQISTFVAIWVAIYGIDSWRREHTGKRRIELAEDALSLFYEIADIIPQVRYPASLGVELKDIQQGEGESEANFSARKNASIVYVRFNQNQETFNKLHAMRYRFMAQIGKDKAKAFDEIREIVSTIKTAAHMLSRLWPREAFRTEEQFTAHRAMVDRYEAIFWEGFKDDDPINPKLDAAIKEIESICQKVISGEGTLYNTLNRHRRLLWMKAAGQKQNAA